MSKIHGSLHVTNSDWRHIYATILNYFNQEITLAYKQALDFWTENQAVDFDTFNIRLKAYLDSDPITETRKQMICQSMIKTGTKIYKPKKNFFNKYTNRTTYVTTSDVTIQFNKNDRSVTIETAEFDDFDKYIANNTFVSEFINMVNCINWPNRTGPNKTIKGCTLLRTSIYSEEVQFFKSGPNPPKYSAPSEVTKPPAFIETDTLKNIKLTTSQPEDTFQPLPAQPDLSEM